MDGKVFVYSENQVHEVKQKLYELEELCRDKNCFSRLQIHDSEYRQDRKRASVPQRPVHSTA
ncbi:hypothetical protein ACFTAO_45710 [Paenibacillus rhizoplanae]